MPGQIRFLQGNLVDVRGFEPLTPCLQTHKTQKTPVDSKSHK